MDKWIRRRGKVEERVITGLKERGKQLEKEDGETDYDKGCEGKGRKGGERRRKKIRQKFRVKKRRRQNVKGRKEGRRENREKRDKKQGKE